MHERHSPTGASSMYRWEACPGSVALCATVPEPPSSPYAEEGTRAHGLAANYIQGVMPSGDYPDEMVSAVRVYTDTCDSYFTSSHQTLGAQRWIEQSLDASASIPGMYGTVDCLIYWPWMKKLVVIDFKYGSGLFVDAKDNQQLLYYAVAASLALDLDVQSAELVIVQPRYESGDGGVRRWEVAWGELVAFTEHVGNAIRQTQRQSAPLDSGEHCRFCPAAAVCPELAKERDLALASDFATPVASAQGYSPEQIAKALGSLDALKAYIKAVDELAYRELEAGRVIPGYKLVAKRPTRKIGDPTGAKTALNAVGIPDEKLFTTPELKSPAQIEKAIPKAYHEVLKPFIVSESSGCVVVPDFDARPAVTRNATTDFLSLSALGLED